MKKNLIISMIIRPSDTCNGPRCGFIEKMCTSLRNENIIPAAKTPSDNSIGSYGSHSFVRVPKKKKKRKRRRRRRGREKNDEK